MRLKNQVFSYRNIVANAINFSALVINDKIFLSGWTILLPITTLCAANATSAPVPCNWLSSDLCNGKLTSGTDPSSSRSSLCSTPCIWWLSPWGLCKWAGSSEAVVQGWNGFSSSGLVVWQVQHIWPTRTQKKKILKKKSMIKPQKPSALRSLTIYLKLL